MEHLLATVFKHPNSEVQETCFLDFYSGVTRLGLDKTFINRVEEYFRLEHKIPSPAFMIAKYPEYKAYFQGLETIAPLETVEEFRQYLQQKIEDDKRQKFAASLSELQKVIYDPTQKIDTAIQSLIVQAVRNTSDPENLSSLDLLSGKDIYEAGEKEAGGPLLFIDDFDTVVGGMRRGTMHTIFAYTGSLKTTCAINSAYRSALELNYNVVYYSAEMQKEVMYLMFLVRHSFDSRFAGAFKPVDWDRVHKRVLTEEEKDFLWNVVEPDFKDRVGNRIWILDPISLRGLGMAELESALLKLHCLMGGVDYFIFDHISVVARGAKDEYGEKNAYVRFLNELAVRFAHGRGLTILLLVQANRSGFQQATQNNGRYDLTAIAEANEIERSSWTVCSIYFHGDFRRRKVALMQALKNRSGPLLEDGVEVLALPEHQVMSAKQEEAVNIDSFLHLTEMQ